VAITITSPNSKVGFIVNAVTADAQACETVLAQTAGKRIKLSHLMIASTAAISIWLGEGAAAGTIDTNLIGPISFGALQILQWNFWPLLELTDDYLLMIDAGGAGQICTFCQGVIE